MAKQGFAAGQGANGEIYSTCDADGNLLFQHLGGTDTAPGGDAGVQDDAPIGSLYSNTSTGQQFKKISDTNADADWVELAASDVVNTTGTGVTTAVTADCVDVDAVACTEWKVMVTDTANPDNKRCITVKGLNNGTAAADATVADMNCTDILKVGDTFNAGIDVVLTGTGPAQQMCLEISSTEAGGIDYMVTRVG